MKVPPSRARIERVEQGHAGVADMDVPGRRRGEANDGLGHGDAYGEGSGVTQGAACEE